MHFSEKIKFGRTAEERPENSTTKLKSMLAHIAVDGFRELQSVLMNDSRYSYVPRMDSSLSEHDFTRLHSPYRHEPNLLTAFKLNDGALLRFTSQEFLEDQQHIFIFSKASATPRYLRNGFNTDSQSLGSARLDITKFDEIIETEPRFIKQIGKAATLIDIHNSNKFRNAETIENVTEQTLIARF